MLSLVSRRHPKCFLHIRRVCVQPNPWCTGRRINTVPRFFIRARTLIWFHLFLCRLLFVCACVFWTAGSWRVTKPALRTIGNIVCAEDDTDYTQHIIDAGAVPCLQQLIAHSNREIQKEVRALFAVDRFSSFCGSRLYLRGVGLWGRRMVLVLCWFSHGRAVPGCCSICVLRESSSPTLHFL